MIFDGMMTKNQILYRPSENGQYTDPGPIGERFETVKFNDQYTWPTYNHPRKIPWTKYVRHANETEWEEVPVNQTHQESDVVLSLKKYSSCNDEHPDYKPESCSGTSPHFYEHDGINTHGQIWTIFDPTTIETFGWQSETNEDLGTGLDYTNTYGLSRTQNRTASNETLSWREKWCPKGPRSEAPYNTCSYEQAMWITRLPYRNIEIWEDMVKEGILEPPSTECSIANYQCKKTALGLRLYLVDQPMASRHYGELTSVRLVMIIPLIFGYVIMGFLIFQHSKAKRAKHMVDNIVAAKHIGHNLHNKVIKKHTIANEANEKLTDDGAGGKSKETWNVGGGDGDGGVDKQKSRNGTMGSFGDLLVEHGMAVKVDKPKHSASDVKMLEQVNPKYILGSHKPKHINTWRHECYLLCDDPQSSKIAVFWGYTITVTIVLSIIALIMETLKSDLPRYSWNFHENSYKQFEMFLTIVFSFELVIRLLVSKSPKEVSFDTMLL